MKNEKNEKVLIEKDEVIAKLQDLKLQKKHIDLLFKNGRIPIALEISQKTRLYDMDEVVAALGLQL